MTLPRFRIGQRRHIVLDGTCLCIGTCCCLDQSVRPKVSSRRQSVDEPSAGDNEATAQGKLQMMLTETGLLFADAANDVLLSSSATLTPRKAEEMVKAITRLLNGSYLCETNPVIGASALAAESSGFSGDELHPPAADADIVQKPTGQIANGDFLCETFPLMEAQAPAAKEGLGSFGATLLTALAKLGQMQNANDLWEIDSLLEGQSVVDLHPHLDKLLLEMHNAVESSRPDELAATKEPSCSSSSTHLSGDGEMKMEQIDEFDSSPADSAQDITASESEESIVPPSSIGSDIDSIVDVKCAGQGAGEAFIFTSDTKFEKEKSLVVPFLFPPNDTSLDAAPNDKPCFCKRLQRVISKSKILHASADHDASLAKAETSDVDTPKAIPRFGSHVSLADM